MEPAGYGQDLARRCYLDVVARFLHGRPHAAALLGDGSQVLGYDDEVSPDHDFSAGMQIFLPSDRAADDAAADVRELPTAFEGHPLAGQVVTTTPEKFFAERLGADPAAGFGLADWLVTPTQVLASLVDGSVFHDPHDLLASRREKLRWYPDDLWRYALAAGWLRIAQEQAFVARAGSRGDDLGSRVIAGRIVREQMRLAFLIERRWAPYGKWFGSAFARLPLADRLHDQLDHALRSDGWREREDALVTAGGILIRATNALAIAAPTAAEPLQYFSRDIKVVDADAAMTNLLAAITDPELRILIIDLGTRPDGAARLPGTIDQAVDSTDVLTDLERRRAARSLLGVRF